MNHLRDDGISGPDKVMGEDFSVRWSCGIRVAKVSENEE
jgi:hypothetical protein